MDFKNTPLKSILPVLLIVLLLGGLLFWKLFIKIDLPASGNDRLQNPAQIEPIKETVGQDAVQSPAAEPEMAGPPAPGMATEEDTTIQEQLDRDRRQQRQTKDLRIKLEQANLELEQEKALAEINKLKKEDTGAFKEPAADRQNNLPEIKVDYIGGDRVMKEAILSIGGTSYQVKEKSNPTADIRVVSISDTSVTLHFSAPQELTKTIDYKPE